MLHVDCVEADDGRVEANICFCDVGAMVEGPRGFLEVGFGAVEGGEECFDCFVVGFLCAVWWVLCVTSCTWYTLRPTERSPRAKTTYVANPLLYTPLFISLYVHSFVSSIVFCNLSGNRSSFACSGSSK